MKNVIIICHESLFDSVIENIVTFTLIVGGGWANTQYCGNSYFVNGFLLIFLLIFVFNHSNKNIERFYSIESAKNYINNL
jgi:hypothetical protein